MNYWKREIQVNIPLDKLFFSCISLFRTYFFEPKNDFLQLDANHQDRREMDEKNFKERYYYKPVLKGAS